MKAITLATAMLCLSTAFSATQTTFSFFFDKDADSLNSSEIERFKKIKSEFFGTKIYKEIYITGHTDADGSDAYNLNLSKRRADYMHHHLVNAGIPDISIDRTYKGENQASNIHSSEREKSKNRRVDIQIFSYNLQNPSDILKEIRGNVEQVFYIDNTKESIIQGLKGMLFRFPAFCFEAGKNKSDYKKIKIIIIEAPRLSDGLLNNVVTMTDKKILQTGGMFKIDAFLNNNPISLKKDSTYITEIPANSELNDMQVFIGNGNNTNEPLLWEPTGEKFTYSKVFKGEKPILKLDQKILEQWKYHSNSKISWKNFKVEIPVRPLRPVAPKRYSKPSKPDINENRFKLSFSEKIGLSKTKQNEIKNQRYQKAMYDYNKQLERYETNIKNYNNQYADYLKDNQTYQTRCKEFESKAKETKSLLDEYRDALNEEAYKSAIPYMIKYLIRKAEKGEDINRDVLHFLSYHVFEPARLKFIDKQNLNLLNLKYIALYKECKNDTLGKLLFGNTISAAHPTLVESGANKYLNELIEKKELNFNQRDTLKTGIETFGKIGDVELVNASTYFNTSNLDYFASNLASDTITFSYLTKKLEDWKDQLADAGYFNPAMFYKFYKSSLNTLNWINCDLFINIPNNQIALLELKPTSSVIQRTFAVIKESNSSISIPKNTNQKYATSLPKLKKVKLVSLGLDEEGFPVIYNEEITLTKNTTLNMNYRRVKLSEIKKIIENT